jgi:hypothetical protein
MTRRIGQGCFQMIRHLSVKASARWPPAGLTIEVATTSSGDSTRKVDASDVPVWIEADELRVFRAWWETLPEPQRNARAGG